MRTTILASPRSMILLIALTPLLGAARDCFGGEEPSVIGVEDAGPETDLGAPLDMEAPIDMALPIDMGMPVDMSTPVDLGPGTGEWTAESIGDTDDDRVITIRIDSHGDKHIAHFGEAGYGYYDHTSAGVWQPTITFHSGGPSTSCEILDSMDVEPSGEAHIAYRVPMGGCTWDGSAYYAPSEIYYVKIDDDDVSEPLYLETQSVPYGVTPLVAVGVDGVAHIVFRDSAGAHARYFRVADGVASSGIDIPGIARPTSIAATGDGSVFVLGTDSAGLGSYLQRRTSSGAFAATATTVRSVAAVTMMAADALGRLHVLSTVEETLYHDVFAAPYATPTSTAETALSDTLYEFQMAVSPTTNEPAMVYGFFHTGAQVTQLRSGVWHTDPLIEAPAGSSAPEQCTPGLAFDGSGNLFVVFQGHGADDLYLASRH